MTNDRIWILLARKLSGEATSTELEELDQLSEHSPNAEKVIEQVGDWWSLDVGADTEFLEATYFAHLERMKDKGFQLNEQPLAEQTEMEEEIVEEQVQKSFPIRQLLVSAVFVTILALCWVFFKPSTVASPVPGKAAEVSTRNGARSKILLPDGSNVWLNSGSKITYSKDLDTGSSREVYLSGEAFFDVVRNEKRPFIIHTAKMDVKVLGTRFNVKAYKEDKTTETSLIKGSVEVFLKSNPSRKYRLVPNQKLVLLNDLPSDAAKKVAPVALKDEAVSLIEIRPLTYLHGTETDIESSWTKNILSFEDEPFVEVAKKMERWYDVQFEFKNKSWEQQFLNGSFEKESLEQAMKALKYSTGFKYKIEGHRILIF